ncbi:hypothetical protein DFA_00192 [Cavenderia fasciculata]|uniref:Uncharacterized protein n=1 Tax=Cavenderia fasciculata TaxID=261658 RepID=F4PXV4_CACFS|nr:uncharacterized protein DFA_00192 [Cavenderia fasciculata]EGG19614.1 hypothetical protein DFA_00192 [Cavenderia fasciculata]|eukprot:XP_004357908.1 hypothetical protein DFA_00192 [Cavenderia fasciculata]
MKLKFLGRKKNIDDDEKVKTKIDEILFRRVWNNIVLKRMICSKIKDYLSKEDRALLTKPGAASDIERYQADPFQFIQSSLFKDRREYALFGCEFLTVDLFKSYFNTHCKEIRISTALEVLSLNRRNYRDIWLFRSVFDYLKERGMEPESMATIHMWRNVIESNNVDLYNYVKSVFPMPEFLRIKCSVVPLAAKSPTRVNTWSYTIHPHPGTELLAQLLDDLIDLNPTENWLECVDFSYLAENGSVNILETIVAHAGPFIPCNSKVPPHFDEYTMIVAIQHRKIDSIRRLYLVNKVPFSFATLMAVARTCDLSFIIALHNIEPEAGRLYTIFLHVINFRFNLYFPPNDLRCNNFRTEFINHVKPLNFIDKILEQQINTNLAIGKHPRNKNQPANTQQHFAIFQRYGDNTNIPSLSFDDI